MMINTMFQKLHRAGKSRRPLREEHRGHAGGSVGDRPTDKDMWSGSRVISAPFLLPRTAAHRKSEWTHTRTCAATQKKGACTHMSRHAHAHTQRIPAQGSGADSVTVHRQQPADDLLLELVNTGHPE